jgi:hypothetical protein
MFILALGSTQPPVRRASWFFFWVNRSGRDVNHSPQSSAEVKSEWICTYSLPICLHGVDRENCALFISVRVSATKSRFLTRRKLHVFIVAPCRPSTDKSTKHTHTPIDYIHIQPHTKQILSERKSAEDIIVTAQSTAYGFLRMVERKGPKHVRVFLCLQTCF